MTDLTKYKKPRVLVVEDELLVRLMVVDCFEQADFDVFEAAHAQEAVDLFNAGERIDLVFTDVRMPGELDGLGLAAWIRKHHPETRVLVTSGELGNDRSSAGLIDIEHFFAKPYSLDRVIECIHTSLAKKVA